ncbi:hypothetical protein TNCV_4860161 [Trichonephila clavipes]|nr:hypothetical protein TNCV_4860161 [Trichonephila clavipes]
MRISGAIVLYRLEFGETFYQLVHCWLPEVTVAKPHPLLFTDHPRFAQWSSVHVSSNEIPQVFDGIQIWRVCWPGKDIKFSQAVKNSQCDMGSDIVLLVLGSPFNKGRTTVSITCVT